MLNIIRVIIILGLIYLCFELNHKLGIFAGICYPALMIVIVCLLTLSLNNFLLITKSILRGWSFKEIDYLDPLSLLVSFSEKATREGLLILEEDIAKLNDKFLQLGIQLIVDGTDMELVKSILTDKKETIISSFNIPKRFFKLLNSILILLIIITAIIVFALPDISPETKKILLSAILSSGVFILFFILTDFRLDNIRICTERYLNLEIVGILSIQAGDNPRIVEEKLKALISCSGG